MIPDTEEVLMLANSDRLFIHFWTNNKSYISYITLYCSYTLCKIANYNFE